MKKIYRHLFLAAVASMALASCTEEPRNTEELVDPWLRERTPVNLRLESQIGAAVITDNWRNDEEGSVTVSLITGGLDMSAVKVVALDFKYPDSEFCLHPSTQQVWHTHSWGKEGGACDKADSIAEWFIG